VANKSIPGVVGSTLLTMTHTAGYNLVLLLRAVSYIGGLFRCSGEILRQMWTMGVASLPVTLLVALFTGMVLALQTGMELMRWGIQEKIGVIVAASMTREMGPLWTGIILAARVGSGMAAEIGTMTVSEEVDALEVMSIDPARFLVLPRLVALVVMAPILTIYANLVGVIGGSIVGYNQIGVSYSRYFQNGLDGLLLKDINTGLVKSVIFAIIIVAVGCGKGMQAKGGAVGVGQATRDTVVVSLILIIAFNYFVTSVAQWIP